MFASAARRKAGLTPRSRRLGMEGLEDRRVMATTYLVLDFTPDFRQGSFAQTFANTRFSNGTAPAWLDFNNDRRVDTTTDVDLAAQAIAGDVQRRFASAASGYNVRVLFGDARTQSNLGARYLDWGRYYPTEQVQVMYIGGRSTSGGQIGISPLAPDGYNIEGYGQAYSQGVANMLMPRPGITPGHFVSYMSATIAHEFGHMLGLRHSQNVQGDLMNPAVSGTPWSDSFSIYNRNTFEPGGPQNATAELRASFAGQRALSGSFNGGAPLLSTNEHEESHCEFATDDSHTLFRDVFLKDGESIAVHEEAATETSTMGPLTLEAAGRQQATDLHFSRQGLRSTSATSANDLVSLLASDVHTSRKEAPHESVGKSIQSVKQLDELFMEFGVVAAK